MVTTAPLRWAVIGTGRISHAFADDIRAAGATVTRVWGRDAARADEFAHRYHASATTQLDRILDAEDIDIAYIATPAATHLPIALKLLSAGKHVLVEKPMAMSGSEAREIFACAEAHDRFAMEGLWMKFNPLHREVFRRAGVGEFGTLRYVRGGFGAPFPPGGSRWSAGLGGSVLFNQAIYTTTLAVWALGPVTSVTVSGTVRDGVDVTAELTLHHERGTSQAAVSALSFVDGSASMSGTKGWAQFDGMFWAGSSARLHSGDLRTLFDEPEPLVIPLDGHGYTPMIRSVHDAIGSGLRQHPEHDALATASVLDVLAAARAEVLGRAVIAS